MSKQELTAAQEAAILGVMREVDRTDLVGGTMTTEQAVRRLRDAVDVVDRIWPRTLADVLRRTAADAEPGTDAEGPR